MKIIAKDHDIIIKGDKKTVRHCADGSFSAANEVEGKEEKPKGSPKKEQVKGKVKSLVGSGKVQDTLSKVQGILGILRGESGAPTETMPPPPEELAGMSTGTKLALGLGVVALVGLIIYTSKKK